MGKTVLITGASSGIGRAAALQFAARGHVVFASGRRADRLEQLARDATGTVVPVQLDVRSPSSVEDAARTVAQHSPDGIDILINNAGYSLIGAVETLPLDDIRDQFETNVMGLLDVTKTFLPHMRARRAGRIVNIGSVLGRMSFVGSGVYGSTKFALEALSDALRMELKQFGISVVLIEPGFTATDIDTAPVRSGDFVADYESVTDALATYTGKATANGIAPDRVADVVVAASLARRPRARYVVPRRYSALLATLGAMPTPLADALKMRQLPSLA